MMKALRLLINNIEPLLVMGKMSPTKIKVRASSVIIIAIELLQDRSIHPHICSGRSRKTVIRGDNHIANLSCRTAKENGCSFSIIPTNKIFFYLSIIDIFRVRWFAIYTAHIRHRRTSGNAAERGFFWSQRTRTSILRCRASCGAAHPIPMQTVSASNKRDAIFFFITEIPPFLKACYTSCPTFFHRRCGKPDFRLFSLYHSCAPPRKTNVSFHKRFLLYSTRHSCILKS